MERPPAAKRMVRRGSPLHLPTQENNAKCGAARQVEAAAETSPARLAYAAGVLLKHVQQWKKRGAAKVAGGGRRG